MSDSDLQSTVLDSAEQHLGGVYAKALLGACDKAGNTSAVLEELDGLLDDVLAKLPDFRTTLCSPRVPHEEKVRLIDAAFGGKVSVELLNFLKVVSSHGRFDCLEAMRQAFHQQYNESTNRIAVKVQTAEPLDEASLQAMSERLKASLGADVILSTSVDPDLIGGLVIRIGDTVYDGSVANRLVQLRNSALQQTIQEIRQSLDRFTLAD